MLLAQGENVACHLAAAAAYPTGVNPSFADGTHSSWKGDTNWTGRRCRPVTFSVLERWVTAEGMEPDQRVACATLGSAQ
jgi:hypothetical protein